ncbi:TonB-dependent receptor [Terriglobus saanensis]|uniref:Cna B domain-containing protein n=1 Tax=Terriglobus saanensis (strain ATCC BAA-1853 / DSM 23119 / SP1PR4) TaxID=401053 RepID=E8V1K6_TERSS|nr:carboxypeptidase regulatory-like domain-containing protein [Terriglobus saanensis]ADV81201.1 Cna B domain-containing protein [Terriglobus saanensis SP1PR4]
MTYTNFFRSALRTLGTFTLLGVMATPSAHAQSQSINGTIRGTVTDPSGAPIAGVNVVVKNLDTGFTRELTSDTSGGYLAPSLPIGTYSVTATSSSFAPFIQSGIHVDAGSDLTVNEALKVGSVATEVQVTGDAPIIETTRVDLGRTISEAEVQNLPLTSRNPYNFILFQPGVSGHPNAENGIPRTVNTNGLVDRVQYQLDGMVDTETDRYGLRLFAISDSYVQQVQTVSNAFNAEFGNTAGIIYNVITPQGTNQLHGMAQYIWRPKAASSCPMLQNCDPTSSIYKAKPDLHVDDFVGRAGGPVVKDRLFLFGAYEKLKRANPQAITVTSANQAALIAAGVAASDFNTAPQVQRAQWVNVRGDWTINKSNQAFIRYNYFRNDYPFNTNVGGLYLQSAASDFRDRAHILGAQLITTFSPVVLNEFRGSWPYRNQAHISGPLTGAGPMVTISSVVNGFGGTNGAGDKFQEKIPSFNDNVTWVHGKHSFKFGTGFQKNLDTQLADVYTQYTFSSITQYLSAKNGTSPHVYSSVAASIGRPGAAYHSIFFSFFAQDTWQIAKNLTANYGVRYDQYRAPDGLASAPLTQTQSFHTPKGNFAPRVGFAYTPMPGTVVRVSGGMYYEATPTNSWYTPLYNNGLVGTGSYIASVANSSTTEAQGAANPCLPAFPNTPSAISTSCIAAQSVTALNPNFKNGYTWNANAQVAQQLGKNDSLTMGYVLTQGRNLAFLRNSNLKYSGLGALADGRLIYSSTPSAATRIDSRFNNITLIDVGSNSSYNALVASYEHRLSAGLTVAANYTWSHAISNTPEGYTYEFSTPVEDTDNPKRDRANSGINRPNSFTLSTDYVPQTHFANKYVNGVFTNNRFSILGNFSSGDAQTITTGTKLNGDSLATSRPLFVGRNTVRTPGIAQVDMRYTRTFATLWERVRPQILVESNNLFNRSNVTTINTTATTNAAGVITTAPSLLPTSSVLESRILQFGAKIEF